MSKETLGMLLAFGIAINATSSCTYPISIDELTLLDRVQSCTGNLDYTPVEFDFAEEWMTKYSFAVEKVGRPIGPLGIGGTSLSKGGDQPVLVRMFDKDDNCILQVESFSLQASSIELFASTFGGQVFGSSALKSFEIARQSESRTELSDIVHIGVTLNTGGGTRSYLSFAVLANEIL